MHNTYTQKFFPEKTRIVQSQSNFSYCRFVIIDNLHFMVHDWPHSLCNSSLCAYTILETENILHIFMCDMDYEIAK